ncbi:apolipoprotein N-acyltransferase [Marinomonas agarivorans]|nr:apolipoprotein N-acyltransferase [Marinomonas agarivorans]
MKMTSPLNLLTRQLFRFSAMKNEIILLFLALFCGAVGALGFSPFHIWPALFLSFGGAVWLLQRVNSLKQAFVYGFTLGLGVFGAGVSWVYVSIAQYGQVGILIAVLATLLFVAVLAVFYGLAFQLTWWAKHRLPNWPLALLLSFSLLLTEFLRSTVFTGFPWLLSGYALHHTWLFELAPLGGIWLLTFLAFLTFSLPASVFTHFRLKGLTHSLTQHGGMLLVVTLAWGVGLYLSVAPQHWVKQFDTLQVTLVQGNISQDQKWLPQNAEPMLNDYLAASFEHLDSNLIVWPETAVTYLHSNIAPYFTEFSKTFNDTNTTLVTGIPLTKHLHGKTDFYNAVWATGQGSGQYLKQRLVPFGEYIPLQSLVGKVLDIFGIPLESFQAGPANQPPLQVGKHSLSTLICYEVAYPSLVRKVTPESDILLTVSNDAWFGDSIGPWQHLEIAQFRAKESGRYLLRSTNTGITAVINEQGVITESLPQFQQDTLTTNANLFRGMTPYIRYGNTLVLTLLILLCLLQLGLARKSAN